MGRRLGILAALAAYVIAEIYVLSVLVKAISISGVIFVLVAQFIIGAWIIKRAGVAALRSLNESLTTTGSTAGTDAADKGLVALAGALIAVPGVLTDAFGVALLIPPIRRWARKTGSRMITKRVERYVGPVSPAGYTRGDDTIVVTSVVRDPDATPREPVGEISQQERLPE